jgi:Tfp pilus assembly protein PilO
MKKFYKLVAIIILILSLSGVLFFLVRPLSKNNAELKLKIAESIKSKTDFEDNIKSLLEIKSRYFILSAMLDKYNTQLPLSGNIPILTDQIYEIEKYSGIKISTINFKEIPVTATVGTKKQNPIGNISIDLNATGSYYQMLTFLNTLEILPRFIRIEKVSFTANQASYNNSGNSSLDKIIISAAVSFTTYYDKTDYKNN